MPRYSIHCHAFQWRDRGTDHATHHVAFFYVVDLQDGHCYPCRIVSSNMDFPVRCKCMKEIGGAIVYLEERPMVKDQTWADSIAKAALDAIEARD